MANNTFRFNDRTSTADHRDTAPVRSNKQRILEHLVANYNFEKHQIAAVMAALKHESNFQVGASGDRNLGRGREAHHLFQWREQRWTNAQRYFAAHRQQDEVTCAVDFAMHEMGIKRKDGANVGGPCFGSERKAGNTLEHARSLDQAVEGMHQFERYDNRSGETGRRHRTALGFIGEVVSAIANGIKQVGQFLWNGVKAVGNAIGSLFRPPEPTPQATDPARDRWQINQGAQPYNQFEPPSARRDFTPVRGQAVSGPYVNSQSRQAPLRSDVVMGDSIGEGMKSQYPDAKNVAVSGVRIRGAISQFKNVPRGSVVDVYLGTNNGGDTPDVIKRETNAFLSQAEARGVRINNWILPGHHKKHPQDDADFRVIADTISKTIGEYNLAHPAHHPIQPIVTRDKGISLAGDGLHLSPTGTRQMKATIAQQTQHTMRPVVASVDQHPVPLNKWRISLAEPKKSA